MDNNRGFSEISASLEENWGRADNWRKGKNIVVSAYRQRGNGATGRRQAGVSTQPGFED